jgi:hypothetical protein
MDSIASPKVKILEGKGACNTSKVEGCARAPRWRLGRLISNSISHGFAQTKQ